MESIAKGQHCPDDFSSQMISTNDIAIGCIFNAGIEGQHKLLACEQRFFYDVSPMKTGKLSYRGVSTINFNDPSLTDGRNWMSKYRGICKNPNHYTHRIFFQNGIN